MGLRRVGGSAEGCGENLFQDSGGDRDLEIAVERLRRSARHFSSGVAAPAWQRMALIAIVAVIAGVAVFAEGGGTIVLVAVGLAFCLIVLLRCLALWHLLSAPTPKAAHLANVDCSALPFYSVLIALHREADALPGLVAAISALDYPCDRLEILFITEEDDAETRRAFGRIELPAHMRIVRVPRGQPKTKPRALNYALRKARGTLIAVFDAEDLPAPDQLRKAASMFSAADRRLACVQGRLRIHNAADGAIARQFALEYGALFHAVLPALDRLGLPLPLGGTSNHFRREALAAAGAWDPFNVTEDADLGIRLARLGYRVQMLDSETLEEAPVTGRGWLGQRTRWLKGWMQTYLVHMRSPLRLWRELGAWGFFGFQLTLGGMIASALMHPWFFALLSWRWLAGQGVLTETDAIWWLSTFNVVAGYGVGAALNAVVAWRLGGGRRAVVAVILLPIYWLAISWAAYRAVFDLRRRPYHWEKTAHGDCNIPLIASVYGDGRFDSRSAGRHAARRAAGAVAAGE